MQDSIGSDWLQFKIKRLRTFIGSTFLTIYSLNLKVNRNLEAPTLICVQDESLAVGNGWKMNGASVKSFLKIVKVLSCQVELAGLL